MIFLGVFDSPVCDKACNCRSEGGEGHNWDRLLGDEPKKNDTDRGDDLAATDPCYCRKGLEKHKGDDSPNFYRVYGESRFVLALAISTYVSPTLARTVSINFALSGS